MDRSLGKQKLPALTRDSAEPVSTSVAVKEIELVTRALSRVKTPNQVVFEVYFTQLSRKRSSLTQAFSREQRKGTFLLSHDIGCGRPKTLASRCVM